LTRHRNTDRNEADAVPKHPTVYDVATRAGVSIATVSRVFQRPELVRQPTRERVLAAADALRYVPSGSARGLASRSTGVLGLCFPDDEDLDADESAFLYVDEVIRGMERRARHHEFALLIAACHGAASDRVLMSAAGHTDGLAVLAGTVPMHRLDALGDRQPIVLIAGRRQHDEFDHVGVANRTGVGSLTAHLTDAHGYSQLAFVAGPVASPDSDERFAGFRAVLVARGLPVPARPHCTTDFTEPDGHAAVSRLLSAGAAPRAIVCANDQTALGALRAVRDAGLRVPDDVAVTGFDDIALAGAARPGLTTVAQPMRHLGAEAVDLLIARMHRPDRTPQTVTLPVAVRVRQSCGCP
jgi:LacI family transcriptional regulator